MSVPTPPFIEVPGIANFRDIGGYPISSSPETHSVRTSYIYRCAEPSRITTDGVSKLQSLGIKYIYDLRSIPEIKKLQEEEGRGEVVEWEGIKRVFAPVFEEKDSGPEGIALRFKNYTAGNPEVLLHNLVLTGDSLKTKSPQCRASHVHMPIFYASLSLVIGQSSHTSVIGLRILSSFIVLEEKTGPASSRL
jgi:hypothetical protein